MTVRILGTQQKSYILEKYQTNEKSVIQLAGQFNVSSRTIKRILAEGGVLTLRPTRDEHERYLLASCKKLGITDAKQLKELVEQAKKTQHELFSNTNQEYKVTGKDVVEYVSNTSVQEASNIAIIAIARMRKEGAMVNQKKQEQVNYGKQFPTKSAYQITVTVSYNGEHRSGT